MSDKRQEANYYMSLAFKALSNGLVEYAVDFYERSLKAQPTPQAHTYLGWAYSMMGNLEQAITHCESAIQLDPAFIHPYNDISVYLIEKGDYDGAVPYLEKAIALGDNNTKHYTHFNLGKVFAEQGLLLKAAEEFRQALTCDPHFELAARGLIEITEQIH